MVGRFQRSWRGEREVGGLTWRNGRFASNTVQGLRQTGNVDAKLRGGKFLFAAIDQRDRERILAIFLYPTRFFPFERGGVYGHGDRQGERIAVGAGDTQMQRALAALGVFVSRRRRNAAR